MIHARCQQFTKRAPGQSPIAGFWMFAGMACLYLIAPMDRLQAGPDHPKIQLQQPATLSERYRASDMVLLATPIRESAHAVDFGDDSILIRYRITRVIKIA